jgi:hypothetical protein
MPSRLSQLSRDMIQNFGRTCHCRCEWSLESEGVAGKKIEMRNGEKATKIAM